MSKIPVNPSEIFKEITADYNNIFGDNLTAIILYGSAALGEYQYKKSDINFLIVLTDNGILNIKKCVPLISKWQKRKVTTPLFLTKDYIQSSLDSFPIEFLGIKLNHQIVYGEDIFEQVEIKNEHLRLQCEREMKGKLLHLREGFLNTANHPRQLKLLISKSIATFATIFMALLTLKNEAIPGSRKEILNKTAELFELDKTIFEELIHIRSGQKKLSKPELQQLVERYIQEISKLSIIVDKL